MQITPTLDAALDHVGRGFRVIPLYPFTGGTCDCAAGAKCSQVGKHPHLNKWPERAVSEPDDVLKMWADKGQGHGVGIVTGEGSGVFVVDVDPRSGGDESLRELEVKHGALRTLRANTGGGGWHLFFSWPEFAVKNSAGMIGRGIDVRGAGGYVVAPGSPHRSGLDYEWADPSVEIAEAPDWLLDTLRPKTAPPKLAVVDGGKAWQRSYTSPSKGLGYGATALDLECQSIREATPGRRNDAVNKSSWSIGQLVGGGEIDHGTARSSLLDACAVHEGVNGWDRAEAVRTVDNGLRRGADSPRSRPIQSPVLPMCPGGESFDEHDERTWSGYPAEVWPLLEKGVKTGLPDGSGLNISTILRLDPRFAGRFWRDDIAGIDYWGERAISTRAPYTAIKNIIQKAYGARGLAIQEVQAQVELECSRQVRDPLMEWIHGLKWDGTPRAEEMLIRGFGASDTKLARGYSLHWMIGAAARAYRPGCMLHHCLILIGKQGCGKSSGLRTLVGSDHFNDADLSLSGHSDSKDAYMAIRTTWVHEFAEMVGLGTGSQAKTKSFLTKSSDKFRPSHQPGVIDVPRRCLFVGTSNDVGVLSDSSGSRRFWPIVVGQGDREWIKGNRDQLWAEAAHLYRSGRPWVLPPDLEDERTARTAEYKAEDPWREPIEEYICLHPKAHGYTLFEVLTDGMRMARDRQGKSDAMRAASILRDLGLVKRRTTHKGVQAMRWTLPRGD